MGDTRKSLLDSEKILKEIQYYTGLKISEISDEELNESVEMTQHFIDIWEEKCQSIDDLICQVQHEKYLYYQTKYNLDESSH